jgi:cytochrome c peroxidase
MGERTFRHLDGDECGSERSAPPMRDAAAVQRGLALFQDAQIGCSTCHNGPKLTNNQTVDVGTGGQFQVPWLVGVAARAPFLHNGCIITLQDRFGPWAGGDQHGKTSQLTAAQINDLVAYLESL